MLADFSFHAAEEIFSRSSGQRHHAGQCRTRRPLREYEGNEGQEGQEGQAGGTMAPASACPAWRWAAAGKPDPERRDLRRVPGQRSHPRPIRRGEGEPAARAAAHHQQLVDERLSMSTWAGSTAKLIAVDGFRSRRSTGRRLPITRPQRLDIRLAIPRAPASHPVLAVLEGRIQTNRHRAACRRLRRWRASRARPTGRQPR